MRARVVCGVIVAIVGAGALGTLFGVTLARDNDVRFLVRDARAHVRGESGAPHVEGEPPRNVTVTSDPDAIAGAALVVVAVKAYDTVTALRPLRGGPASALPFVSLQNGLAAVEHIEIALGKRATIALAPTTEAALRGDRGTVRRTGAGGTMLGWADGRDGGPILETFAAALRRAGLAATVVRPIEPHVWAKAIVNAALNPITALSGVPNGAILERPELYARVVAVAREGAAVAAAAGVVLPFRDAAAHVLSVARATAMNDSSMLQDLRNAGPTEIEAINGAIVGVATRFGVAVPEMTRALDEVRARAKA